MSERTLMRLLHLSWLLAMALVLSCCGGTAPAAPPPPAPPGPAQGLDYQDPDASGWRLSKDASSTPERLVLNLVGPTGLKTRGAAFNLQVPPSVHVGGFPEFGYEDRPDRQLVPVKSTGVYELLRCSSCSKSASQEDVCPLAGQACDVAMYVCRTPAGCFQSTEAGRDPLEPVLATGGVKPGNLLTVGVFQKDRRAYAKESGVALLQIALEFDGTAGLLAGDELPLKILRSRYMADDVGKFSVVPTYEQVAKANLLDMQIRLGVLRAK
jgi:hypothetical protein